MTRETIVPMPGHLLVELREQPRYAGMIYVPDTAKREIRRVGLVIAIAEDEETRSRFRIGELLIVSFYGAGGIDTKHPDLKIVEAEGVLARVLDFSTVIDNDL